MVHSVLVVAVLADQEDDEEHTEQHQKQNLLEEELRDEYTTRVDDVDLALPAAVAKE